MVRTCPFGPAGPIGLPFSEIVIPPAFPRRSVTSFTPSTVRVVCASMLAENAYLPSLRASTHAASSAVISTCTVASGLGGVTRATAGAGLGSAGIGSGDFRSAGRCSTTCAGVAAGSTGGGGGAFALVEGEGWAGTAPGAALHGGIGLRGHRRFRTLHPGINGRTNQHHGHQHDGGEPTGPAEPLVAHRLPFFDLGHPNRREPRRLRLPDRNSVGE